MNQDFLTTIKSFKITSKKQRITDDDLVDRLNHYYTAILLIIFSILLCAKQYVVGDPLQCWIPPEFKKPMEEFAENYCWMKNTYFVAPNNTFPDVNNRSQSELQYYQWVPFVLALQAFMFFIPILFWRTVNWQSGVSIKDFISIANLSDNIDHDKRDTNVSLLGRLMARCLIKHRSSRTTSHSRIRSYLWLRIQLSDYFLIVTYLTTKLLFILNVIIQFVLLDAFLGSKYSFYGLRMVIDVLAGRTWHESGHFPHVTFCDFSIRDFGQQARHYTLQCVLVINMFNEKVYLFLWFWFVLVCAVNIYNFFKWCFILFSNEKMNKMIDYIKLKDKSEESEKSEKSEKSEESEKEVKKYDLRHLNRFIKRAKRDSILVMQLIKMNCGGLLQKDIAQAIYRAFYDIVEKETVDAPTMPKESILLPEKGSGF